MYSVAPLLGGVCAREGFLYLQGVRAMLVPARPIAGTSGCLLRAARGGAVPDVWGIPRREKNGREQ